MKWMKTWSWLIGLGLLSGAQASDRAGYFGLMDADTYVGLGVAQQTIKVKDFKDTKVPGLVLTVGTQVSSWVDAEFRVSTNQKQIDIKHADFNVEMQFDEFYDVSGLFKFKWQGQGSAQPQPLGLHATLGYNFSQYKTREVNAGVAQDVNKQTQDGFMYGVGASFKLNPSHTVELNYLSLQSRDSFDNTGQMKRDSIGLSWLYYY
ncbi:outer membrane beta-barrel protein [Thiomicrospira pelophila]|uniref:outer membrane beta-barrel protein n=1 Tax=Thiomicrospira pelophila TaxID=934 RepID=UPI0004A733AD|nr:outer membrane beta-barrel protein [Thiomicrospira pelophila]